MTQDVYQMTPGDFLLKELLTYFKDGAPIDVTFTKNVEDLEGFPQENMRARITSARRDMDDVIALEFDYGPYEDYNRPFESSKYYDKRGQAVLTAREAGKYQVKVTHYFDPDSPFGFYFVKVHGNQLRNLELYNEERRPHQTYVDWLEERLARAEAGLASYGAALAPLK